MHEMLVMQLGCIRSRSRVVSHVAVKVPVVAQDDNITLVITQESLLAGCL